MLIGHFGGNRYPIEREETFAPSGVKQVWFCGCPQGNMYPLEICRHLQAIFDDAANGVLPKRLHLSAEGETAASACGCIARARAKVTT
jgi:hypothetical protein